MDRSSASPAVSEANNSRSEHSSVSASVDGSAEDELIQDEKAFKKQQRMIANRISAEKLRLKVRTELAELRRKVEILSSENQNLRKELQSVSRESNIIKEELTRFYGKDFIPQLVNGYTGSPPQD